MRTRRYLQRFGEDALSLLTKGWKLIDTNHPGYGVYRRFKHKRKEIYVFILPSIGYPRAPPIVIFLASDENALDKLGHECIWDDLTLFLKYAPKWLRDLMRDPSYAKRFLHILSGNEGGLWGRLVKSENRLQIINDFLIYTLNLEPSN